MGRQNRWFSTGRPRHGRASGKLPEALGSFWEVCGKFPEALGSFWKLLGSFRKLPEASGSCWEPLGSFWKMIILLLFLQKQSLAYAVYLFGFGTLLTARVEKKITCDNALTMTSPVHWWLPYSLGELGGVLNLLPVNPSQCSLVQVINTDVTYFLYCRSHCKNNKRMIIISEGGCLSILRE